MNPKGESMAVKDPVSGMGVDPRRAAAKEAFEGRTYVFCSEHCHRQFVDPPVEGLHWISCTIASHGARATKGNLRNATMFSPTERTDLPRNRSRFVAVIETR